MFFSVDKHFVGAESDVLLVFVYIPPRYASFYDNNVNKNGITILEETFLDILQQLKSDPLVVLWR